jgi:MFS transporter, ACS family, glucarate transporter
LDPARLAGHSDRRYPLRRACWRGGGRADRRLSDYLVFLAFFAFAALGTVSGVWAALWWWNFHEDPRQHPGITAAELAALSTADPGRQIAYGPVPRLVPRMTPMMIIYFCQGWTGWLYVTWMPSLFQKNYGLDLKKSSLLYAAMLFSAMFAELLGGVVTDYLLRRTRSVQIARSAQIAVSWSLAVAALVPAILVHNLYVGLAGFTLTLFFMGWRVRRCGPRRSTSRRLTPAPPAR